MNQTDLTLAKTEEILNLRFSQIFDTGLPDTRVSWGLLLMRLSVGLMMHLGHGHAKLMSYAEKSSTFGDPLGIGSPLSMALAVFAEFFCSLGIVFGFATRLSAIPLLTTMLVAGLIVHADDPWGRKELAFLYAVCFLALIIVGGGKYSLDYLISKKLKSSRNDLKE